MRRAADVVVAVVGDHIEVIEEKLLYRTSNFSGGQVTPLVTRSHRKR